MSVVNLSIVNQIYPLGCEDGQEERLLKLASLIDTKARSILNVLGPLDERMLLATVAVVLADELQTKSAGSGDLDVNTSIELEKLLARIKSISKKL